MLPTKEENKPFLAGDGEPDSFGSGQKSRRFHTRRSFKAHGLLIAFHLVFLGFNLVVSVNNTAWKRNKASRVCYDAAELDMETFSPARSAIEYTAQEFHYGHESDRFTGPPRPEFDEAWSELLRSSTVKLSEDEMRRMNKTSVMLKDGSGYIGYLEAIHMLHCVKRIYQLQHPEHYPELQSGDAFTIHHLNHCLEILRQGIMCNVDVTVNTYFWEKPGKIKGNRSGARKCTDWGRLQTWADERTLIVGDGEKFLDMLVQGGEVMDE